ncbi:MAG TPA: hypothetical protein VHE35_10960, partial [Kofleriaceae bacterium]|nr:hypothetical protein [Kofleriaceae bacterium]
TRRATTASRRPRRMAARRHRPRPRQPAAAADLLQLDPELKTEAVAAQVGFGSAGRLAAALRRELGVSAAELRRRPDDPSSHRS